MKEASKTNEQNRCYWLYDTIYELGTEVVFLHN